MQQLTLAKASYIWITASLGAALLILGLQGQVRQAGRDPGKTAEAETLVTPPTKKHEADSSEYASQVETSVVRMLEQGHYTRHKMDAIQAQKVLESYLRLLDPNRLFFMQEDILSFQQTILPTLKNSILQGSLTPAREIYAVYKQRVEDRVAKNKLLLKQPLSFVTNETVSLNREKSDWIKDKSEADILWRRWMKVQILQERLASDGTKHKQEKDDQKLSPDSGLHISGKRYFSTDVHNHLPSNKLSKLVLPKTAEDIVERRFDNILRNLKHEASFNVVAKFLSAISQSYDPHSDYLSPERMKNFAISMKLSLVGIGVVLQDINGYTRIADIIPGGPADKDGRLKVNDCIIGVAQGNSPFEDVVNINLERIVERIRGQKGTLVRLLIISKNSLDTSKRKLIGIVRDEVRLKDQQARAEVIDLKRPHGVTTRIGWITLPSFYADIDSPSISVHPNTTRDVSILLKRLEQERIQGLIVDLRRNGGGSLQEAINLTGLFIPPGPVLQVKDNTGKITVSSCEATMFHYSGPLVVLVNHLSASASEIFAAALQDYGRAVIVGDSRTFSKGTVQTILDVGRFMPCCRLTAAEAGSLKLTIQKFYRVSGGSTQLKGVESDIVLPSLLDDPRLGEAALPHALPYDEVSPVRFQHYPGKLFLDQLRKLSTDRVSADPEFIHIREGMARARKRLRENIISINEKTRRAEIEESKSQQTRLENELAARGPGIEMKRYRITVDTVHHPQLEVIQQYIKPRETRPHFDPVGENSSFSSKKARGDPIKNETLRIAHDLIHLSAAARRSRTLLLHP